MRIKYYKHNIYKLFFIGLYVLFWSIPRLLLSETLDDSLTRTLWYDIWGHISAGNADSIIMSTESIGFVLLFALLFGDFFSKDFSDPSPYIFSRIGNRKYWFAQRLLHLLGYAMQSICFMLTIKIIVLTALVSDNWLTSNLIITVILLIFLLLPILLLSCLGINLISIKRNIVVGISIIFIVILLLEFVAIMFWNNPWNIIFNPFCCNIKILDNHVVFMQKSAANMWLILIEGICATIYIYHLDIF